MIFYFLFFKGVKDMEVKFDMTPKIESNFECLQAVHVYDFFFLLVISIDGLDQHISLVDYRSIFKYRFMIPLFSIDEDCHVCSMACISRKHATHCREILGFKYSHDFVRSVFFDLFKQERVSMKKDARLNFMIDSQEDISTLMAANVVVYMCMKETCICGFNWAFLTCEIDDQDFNCGINIPQTFVP